MEPARDHPGFGSLFTLCLPLILLCGPRRRTGALALATWLGVAIWFWTYHQDRYLQALLPWMTVVVAAVFSAVWRAGWLSRLAVAVLVSAQLIWGGDAYSIPSHAMIGQPPAKVVLDLISSGYRREFAARFASHADLAPVGALLPPHSKVLVHERHLRLGLGAMSVNDASGSQAGISYALLQTPRAVHALLKSFGVTHMLWTSGSSMAWQTTAADLVFFEFVEKFTVNKVNAAGSTLAALPAEPPRKCPSPAWCGFRPAAPRGPSRWPTSTRRCQAETSRPPKPVCRRRSSWCRPVVRRFLPKAFPRTGAWSIAVPTNCGSRLK